MSFQAEGSPPDGSGLIEFEWPLFLSAMRLRLSLQEPTPVGDGRAPRPSPTGVGSYKKPSPQFKHL
ncbi:hypothetical protein B9Z49_10135 [Limnohabitans sp. 2KL-51]|nr:hypothetical protein B9Z49_10135 [Limnohabitans sp. 2KL-51]